MTTPPPLTIIPHMNDSNPRDYKQCDHLIIGLSRMLGGAGVGAGEGFPGEGLEDAGLSARERRLAGRYMRVNHVGEVCAQALYYSQAATARDPRIRARMERAADEERAHLAWCERRLSELGARPSRLNPLWRLGAFGVGALAGLAGDRWNLAFVAETERQVSEHLESHLSALPANDARSRAVVARMRDDERRHADAAVEAGAAELPPPVKRLMRLAAKAMTSTAHWI